MFVFCECCVLSGRGLCDEQITHWKSPANCGVSLCVILKPKEGEAMVLVGPQTHRKNNLHITIINTNQSKMNLEDNKRNSFVNLIPYIFCAIDMQGYIYYQQIALVNLYKIIILTFSDS